MKVESGNLVFRAGAHYGEPLLIEAGEKRRVSIVLESGAQLHLVAFVLAADAAADRAGEASDGVTEEVFAVSKTSGEASDTKAELSLTVDLAGEGAEFHLHAPYMASGVGEKAGRADIEVRVNHLVSDCVSRQLIKGIAAGEATGAFTGMVHVAADAQRIDAVQRNQNLQLSDTAHIFARPQLEIYADDVKCSHGATVGRLDEEAVYYMRQRGISEAEARRLQMHGFVGEIINHCQSDSFRDDIGAKIENLLLRL